MGKPRRLEPGDRVGIVAPASPFDRAAFDDGIAEIRTLGFEPVFDEGVFARTGYLAGSVTDRAAALQSAWRDPTIHAIMAARGGYGSAQLLPLLDASEAAASRTPFIGSSDLTSLLTFLTLRCGTAAFHGPMVVTLGRGTDGYDRRSLVDALMRARPLGELCTDGCETLVRGEVRGLLLGGTLSQILASLGTPFAFDPPAGHVLLLDETGERPYRLDRMLTQLAQSGILARAGGVICAEFPHCDEPDGRLTARTVVSERLRGFPGPVVFGFPTGHTTRPMVTLPLGVEVTVTSEPRARVVVEESAVA